MLYIIYVVIETYKHELIISKLTIKIAYNVLNLYKHYTYA